MDNESHNSQPRSRKLVRTGTPGIYKRGPRYVVVFRDRLRKQHKRSARTFAEARQLKAALTADVARGEFHAAARLTFADYAGEWITHYQGRTKNGIREETRRDYRRALGLKLDGTPTGDGAVAFFGRMRLCDIEPRDIKRYAAKVAERGVSPSTVRLALAPVKALLATAVEEGIIRSNPSTGVRLVMPAPNPTPTAEKRKALTKDELLALLDELPPVWRLRVEFLAQTGLRISEALALTWADIDFGRRRVRIERRLRDGKLGPLKSSYARREVPLSVLLAQALWVAKGSAPDSAFIFVGRNGKPLDRSHGHHVVQAAAKRVGVPGVGFHTLRHTAATLAFRSGWNAKQVQQLLGHHSAAFTLSTYVHALPDDLPEPTFLESEVGSAAALPDPVQQTDSVNVARRSAV